MTRATTLPRRPVRIPARTVALLALALTFAVSGFAQETDGDVADAPPPRLAELAAAADLVALVQVLDTDYEYAREFPVGGTAFLDILIPYKLDRPLPDIVEVYEEGLHPGECYFPNPPVTEEGRRYLLFVRRNPEVEGQYLGLESGCTLTALVTEDNRYALRYPLHGLAVSDPVDALAQPVDYADSHAVLDYEELEVDERNDLLARDLVVERDDRTYKLTHGVPLGDIRRLLGAENLTTDRALLRPPPAPDLDPGP